MTKDEVLWGLDKHKDRLRQAEYRYAQALELLELSLITGNYGLPLEKTIDKIESFIKENKKHKVNFA